MILQNTLLPFNTMLHNTSKMHELKNKKKQKTCTVCQCVRNLHWNASPKQSTGTCLTCASFNNYMPEEPEEFFSLVVQKSLLCFCLWRVPMSHLGNKWCMGNTKHFCASSVAKNRQGLWGSNALCTMWLCCAFLPAFPVHAVSCLRQSVLGMPAVVSS